MTLVTRPSPARHGLGKGGSLVTAVLLTLCLTFLSGCATTTTTTVGVTTNEAPKFQELGR